MIILENTKRKAMGFVSKWNECQRSGTIWMMAIAMVLVVASCGKSGSSDCLSYGYSPVTAVARIDSVKVNQSVDIKVRFPVCGCGRFDAFEMTSIDDTAYIRPRIKNLGCICNDACISRDTTLQFRPNRTGTFVLNFLKGDQTYITDTIHVY